MCPLVCFFVPFVYQLKEKNYERWNDRRLRCHFNGRRGVRLVAKT